jgi:hypothetical protein
MYRYSREALECCPSFCHLSLPAGTSKSLRVRERQTANPRSTKSFYLLIVRATLLLLQLHAQILQPFERYLTLVQYGELFSGKRMIWAQRTASDGAILSEEAEGSGARFAPPPISASAISPCVHSLPWRVVSWLLCKLSFCGLIVMRMLLCFTICTQSI